MDVKLVHKFEGLGACEAKLLKCCLSTAVHAACSAQDDYMFDHIGPASLGQGLLESLVLLFFLL